MYSKTTMNYGERSSRDNIKAGQNIDRIKNSQVLSPHTEQSYTSEILVQHY